MEHPENQYLQLIRQLLEKGTRETGRNGGVLSSFGHSMRFSLADGELPLLTTKKLAYKACFHELMWFLSGCTDNKKLQDKGVHIWDQNTRPEDSSDIGPGYGFQWCHWGAEYETCRTDYTGKGFDQIQHLVEQLRDPQTRSSRRLILSAWNVSDLARMALPPCHMMCQFHVREGKYLSCGLFQRSADVGLGMPFNIASYSFLTHILAKHTGLVAEELVYFIGNAHIYENHVEPLTQQIQREPLPFPKIRLKRVRDTMDSYDLEDIEWERPYLSHEKISMDMTA